MGEIGSLEVRSEVATSDLKWRRVGMPESPCVECWVKLSCPKP